MVNELSSHLIAFFADSQNGTDFSQGFSLRLISNFDAFMAVWNRSEDFRFILVAYINIFFILLVFAYVYLKNLNQYMGEKRKKRLARNAPRVQRAWSTNVVAAEPKRRSYVKLPTPET